MNGTLRPAWKPIHYRRPRQMRDRNPAPNGEKGTGGFSACVGYRGTGSSTVLAANPTSADWSEALGHSRGYQKTGQCAQLGEKRENRTTCFLGCDTRAGHEVMLDHHLLPWVAFYGLVVAVVFGAAGILEGTTLAWLGLPILLTSLFIFMVPVLLLLLEDRGIGHKWTRRLLNWHVAVTCCILLVSLIVVAAACVGVGFSR